MPAPSEVGAWIALLNGLCIFGIASFRRKRLDAADAGAAGVAFLASYNLYPPIVLFLFAMNPASYKTLPPALSGYEKYLAAAEFISFLFTVVSIASSYVKAWKVP